MSETKEEAECMWNEMWEWQRSVKFRKIGGVAGRRLF
jgi:hypothetical protein